MQSWRLTAGPQNHDLSHTKNHHAQFSWYLTTFVHAPPAAFDRFMLSGGGFWAWWRTDKWSRPGMGNDKSWKVSSRVDTRSQVKHWTDDRSFPSNMSLIIERWIIFGCWLELSWLWLRLLLDPARFVMADVVDEPDEAIVCLWLIGGLGDLEIFRILFELVETSSERLDCSDTPLSHVSYSASGNLIKVFLDLITEMSCSLLSHVYLTLNLRSSHFLQVDVAVVDVSMYDSTRVVASLLSTLHAADP